MISLDEFQKKFGDRACGMMGAIDILSEFPANLTIVVHGDRGCMTTSTAGNVYISNMSEVEVISGGEELLKGVIDEIIEKKGKSECIVIVSTCLSAMIGDDINSVAKSVEEKHSVPTIPLNVNGLAPLTPVEVSSIIYRKLAEKFVKKEKLSQRKVGFVGYPNIFNTFLNELNQALSLTNMEFGGIFPQRGITALKTIKKSKNIFVSDMAIFGKFVNQLQKINNFNIIKQPVPFSINETVRFYKKLGEIGGEEEKMESFIKNNLEKINTALSKFKSKHRGKRVACSFGNNRKGASIESTVHLGIGYVELLKELELEPVLIALADENDEKKELLKSLSETLQTMDEFYIHRTPEKILEVFKKTEFDLAINEDCQKHFIDQAGIPFFRFSKFEPGFGGIMQTIQKLEEVLS